MKAKKVLITGYHSSLNNGDRALLEMNIKHIRQAFEQCNITVCVNWPYEEYFQGLKDFEVAPSPWHVIKIRPDNPVLFQLIEFIKGLGYAKLYIKGKRKTIPESWRKIFSLYETSDVITSVSSTMFYSTGRFGWPFPVKTWVLELAHLFHKPLFILPQSIGPFRWEWEKRLFRRAFNKASLIMLRDKQSIREANKLKLPAKNVHFVPDPTFAYEPAETGLVLPILEKYGWFPELFSIGITIIPWQGRWVDTALMDKYVNEIARFIREFKIDIRHKFFLFNQVTGPTIYDDDRTSIRELLRKLEGQHIDIAHVSEIMPPFLLKGCYGKMKLFIATRMHSGIFAMSMGVPTIYISYLQKTKGLMEWLNFSDWLIDISELNAELLSWKVQKVIKEIEWLTEEIQAKLPEIVREIEKIPELLKTYL